MVSDPGGSKRGFPGNDFRSRRGGFFWGLESFTSAWLDKAHPFPTPLILGNTCEAKERQERVWSGGCAAPRDFAGMICCLLPAPQPIPASIPAPQPIPASIPACLGQEGTSGSWRVAKGLQPFLELRDTALGWVSSQGGRFSRSSWILTPGTIQLWAQLWVRSRRFWLPPHRNFLFTDKVKALKTFQCSQRCFIYKKLYKELITSLGIISRKVLHNFWTWKMGHLCLTNNKGLRTSPKGTAGNSLGALHKLCLLLQEQSLHFWVLIRTSGG